MSARYFDSKEIELCNAIGEFTIIESDLERYLPFPKEQMNFIIKHDESHEDIDVIKSDMKRIYPDKDLELPKMEAGSRVFEATASGSRSAVIDSSGFDKDVVFDGDRVVGIKIKGCRMLNWPPIPTPHAPDTREGRPFPEMFVGFKEDGSPAEGIKDQPWGMTVRDATHEMCMSVLVHDLEIPTNVAGLGVGSYSGSFYPGVPEITMQPGSEQMGTAVLAMFGPDERVSDLFLNARPPDEPEKLEFPAELSLMVLNNLQSATEELDTDYYGLLYDMIFHETGKILAELHSRGIVHGPRQSHYMNYTRPTRDYGVRICDFESSLLVSYMTDIQTMKFMTNDLYQLIAHAQRLYLVAVTSAGKAAQSKMMPEGFDPKEMLMQLVDREPADAVLCGYTNDEIGLEDVKDYEPWDLEYHIIERTRKESLQYLREHYGMLFEKVEKLRTFP